LSLLALDALDATVSGKSRRIGSLQCHKAEPWEGCPKDFGRISATILNARLAWHNHTALVSIHTCCIKCLIAGMSVVLVSTPVNTVQSYLMPGWAVKMPFPRHPTTTRQDQSLSNPHTTTPSP
jgi:hypothetical protein